MQLLCQLPLLGLLQLEALPLQRPSPSILAAHPGRFAGPSMLQLTVCTAGASRCCCCKWASAHAADWRLGPISGLLLDPMRLAGLRPQALASVAEGRGGLLPGEAAGGWRVNMQLLWLTLNALPLQSTRQHISTDMPKGFHRPSCRVTTL